MSKRIFLSVLLVLMLLICVNSYASTEDLNKIEQNMNTIGQYPREDVKETNIGKIINSIIGIIQYAGSGIAVITVSILGIKYLLTSPSEKAEIKKMAEPIVIGCVLLFGSVNIAAIIYYFTKGAFG